MSEFTRQETVVLEIDVDKCENTYGVAPCTASGAAGSECYNTFQTCQDKPNYIKGTVTWKFCTPGAPVPPGEQIRPYIRAGGIAFAPTEIDLEKGLASRSGVTVTLQDPPDSDIAADPYAATRAIPAQGSFWTRFLARNRNYAGRFARLKTAYLTDGWDAGAFVTELYVIERIEGPDANGAVRVVLKDPVKLADRARIPPASAGALASAITASSTSLPLGTGEGAGYAASGWVRIGDEVIGYTTNSSDTLSGLTRGAFDTTAEAADEGDAVQQCRVWQSERVWQVLEDLLSESGVAAANVDSAGFEAEDDQWLGPAFAVTAVISKPERPSAMIGELLGQVGAFMWWDPVAQKVAFEVNAPLSPGETAVEVGETGEIVEGTLRVDTLEDLRITRRMIAYDLATATSDDGRASSYARGRLHIDADAESANEYGDVRESVALSRWFTTANDAAVLAMASRRVGYYRNAPRDIRLALDPKDSSLRESDLVDLASTQLVDTEGAPAVTRCLVLFRRAERGRIAVKLRTTGHGARYGFIGGASIGDYPSDPEYAHIAPDENGFTVDGTSPYLIF